MPTKRKKGSSTGWMLAAAFFLGGTTVLALYAEKLIAPLLQGELSGPYPTRIYSAPVRLRPGSPFGEKELLRRLERLNYKETAALPSKAGEYRKSGSSFEVFLRDFQHPFVRSTPGRISVEFDAGSIRSLRLETLRAPPQERFLPLVEAFLEPELMYEISGERRVRREPLRSSEIPKAMADAIVAIEDRRFRSHHGVDPRGMMRAAWKNAREGRIAQGGSTLTQQLARALFLSPRRTFPRKVKEILCALYLDARFSKDELLRMYLDTVYFGQDGPVGILGLSAAARHFFDKEPSKLSLPEAALLAGLLRSPYGYDPFRDPQAALNRRNTVLAAMRREGTISKAEESRAASSPLTVTRAGHPGRKSADYSVAFVQRQLERSYGDEALLTKGLTIFTTFDPWLQELAQQAVRSASQQAALVALEPRTGAVLALVGGKDYAQSPFDRASLGRRQPGSAFKPFVYGAALSEGSEEAEHWTAASILQDEPKSFPSKAGVWRPRNFDGRYQGRVTLRTALAQSLNLATVRLAESVGPRRIVEFARRMGIVSPLQADLGLALGAFEVSLLELTGAYCPFANAGLRVEPYAVEAAMDSEGEMLEYHAPQPVRAISPAEAYIMTSLLREVVLTGTAKSLESWGLADVSAGKTGTTNDGKDAWFIGYTPRLAAGVWTGSDRPARLGLSGAGDAIPIWAGFMSQASGTPLSPPAEPGRAPGTASPRDPWPKPEGVSVVEVDPATGLRVKSGCPQRRFEFFLSGYEPREECGLHPGGVGGWLKKLFAPRRKEAK